MLTLSLLNTSQSLMLWWGFIAPFIICTSLVPFLCFLSVYCFDCCLLQILMIFSVCTVHIVGRNEGSGKSITKGIREDREGDCWNERDEGEVEGRSLTDMEHVAFTSHANITSCLYTQKKISTMTADEYFVKHPELKQKFDDEIRNDYWGY